MKIIPDYEWLLFIYLSKMLTCFFAIILLDANSQNAPKESDICTALIVCH